jgi:uncharacterized protein (TIGR02611 family)
VAIAHSERGGAAVTGDVDDATRLVRIVAGFGLLAAGVAMLALPGPGWLTIAAGLAILAREFEWARRLLNRVKAIANRIAGALH